MKKNKINYIVLFILFCNSINLKAQSTSMWNGSGIILSNDGYIATNNHVIEGGLEYFVDIFANGIKKTFKAKVIKTDVENDLAVIKIIDPNFKKYNDLPYSMKIQGINVGEKVFAMGYPQIGLQGEEVKVTDGIISSKTGFQNDNKTYQISAPIQHGNSGGPLFDNSGNLIGLTSSGLPSAQNVGWAIKISYLNNLLDLIPDFPTMPIKTTITQLSFTEKIKVLSKFTVLIRVTKANCDLKKPSELFNTISTNSSLKFLEELFNNQEDNYRSDGGGLKYYKWYFCENKDVYIDCWFLDNKIFLAMKSFKNETCNFNVNDINYKMIKTGLSYSDVCKIMQSEGDKYRTDFRTHGNGIEYFKWFDCRNDNLYIDVWFLNGKVHLVRKGDVSQEKSLFGK